MPGKSKSKAKKVKKKSPGKSRTRAKTKARVRAAPSRSGGMVSSALSAIGGAVGSYIAPGIGGPVGSALGGLVGGAIGRITGSGDYKITANSLLGLGPVPSFGVDAVRIRHREYLGDVESSLDFAYATYAINPGNSLCFPWLSTIASNYEQYHFNGLVFKYVSTSAVALNSVNTALGKVAMATDYDSVDPDFHDVRSMLATQFANYGKPAEDLLHAIECAPGSTPTELYYVRTGDVPAGADIRLYDLGRMQFATEGMQAVSDIGGLWVTYDVTFVKPQLGFPDGSIHSKVFSLTDIKAGLFTTPTDLGPMQGSFAMTLVNGGTAAMVLNGADVGTVWSITLWVNTGNPLGISGSPTTSFSDCKTLIAPQTVGQVYLIAVSGILISNWLIQTTGPNPTVTLGGLNYLGGGGKLYITQVNSNVALLPQVPFTPAPEEDKECVEELKIRLDPYVSYSVTDRPMILKRTPKYEISKFIRDVSRADAARIELLSAPPDPRSKVDPLISSKSGSKAVEPSRSSSSSRSG
jgi:hypothetical protein